MDILEEVEVPNQQAEQEDMVEMLPVLPDPNIQEEALIHMEVEEVEAGMVEVPEVTRNPILCQVEEEDLAI